MTELHICPYIDTFKAFPATGFAITLAIAPHRLGPPDRTDKVRLIAIHEELTPDEIVDLRLLTSEIGRVVLLFSRWPVFNAVLRCLRSPAA